VGVESIIVRDVFDTKALEAKIEGLGKDIAKILADITKVSSDIKIIKTNTEKEP